jgi:hypothetical protein
MLMLIVKFLQLYNYNHKINDSHEQNSYKSYSYTKDHPK